MIGDITSVARNTTVSFVSFKGGIRRMLEARLVWLGLGDGSATTPCPTSNLAPSPHQFVDGPFLRLKRELEMARMQEELDDIRRRNEAREGIAPTAGTATTPFVCVCHVAASASTTAAAGPTAGGATAHKRGPYKTKVGNKYTPK